MIDAIRFMLIKRCTCDVTRVDVHGARLKIWLACPALDDRALPWRIGHHTVGYHLSNTLNKTQSAFHMLEPRRGNPDDAIYGSNLRPGIMSSNGKELGSELLTTSGVLIKALNGERYVTISAHGFTQTSTTSEPAEVLLYHTVLWYLK
jgi:hypothetical protein